LNPMTTPGTTAFAVLRRGLAATDATVVKSTMTIRAAGIFPIDIRTPEGMPGLKINRFDATEQDGLKGP